MNQFILCVIVGARSALYSTINYWALGYLRCGTKRYLGHRDRRYVSLAKPRVWCDVGRYSKAVWCGGEEATVPGLKERMNETKGWGSTRRLWAELCKLTARLDCKRVQNLFAQTRQFMIVRLPRGTKINKNRGVYLLALTLAGSATLMPAFSLIASRSSELWLLPLSGITPAISASLAMPCCVDGAATSSVLLCSESEGGSRLRKRRIGLDHLAKQRESTRASASRAAMTRTPTRFR